VDLLDDSDEEWNPKHKKQKQTAVVHLKKHKTTK
jgi:hypothetical protein